MTLQNELDALSNGAHFLRADLHIHSFGGGRSYDVKDNTMGPTAIVTHNANIAVLGDAELIIPLRGQSENSAIRDRGTIDSPTTKEVSCTILEGGTKAFKRRLKLYGF